MKTAPVPGNSLTGIEDEPDTAANPPPDNVMAGFLAIVFFNRLYSDWQLASRSDWGI